MLTKILSRNSCAKCRLCCVFDRYDLWETPSIENELREYIKSNIGDDIEYTPKGDMWLFKMKESKEDGLYRCPMLNDTGCILGEKKPFECAIWPYRIMEVEGKRAISIAPICDSVNALPLATLLSFAKEIAPKIFAYADLHPDIIKPYDGTYPVLLFESDFKIEN
ncbi:MAG: hypothetical protein IJO29_08895 [Oscillospiraceae bacterium]|nr:hypothetical protein [Oscillospiraceae bacterium]